MSNGTHFTVVVTIGAYGRRVRGTTSRKNANIPYIGCGQSDRKIATGYLSRYALYTRITIFTFKELSGIFWE
jgi:hypothetical protein